MIYKIIGDFNQIDKIIQILSKKYEVMLYNNMIYIYDKDKQSNKKNIIKQLKRTIKSTFYFTEIDDNILKYEPQKVVEWCKEKFIAYDTLRFEEERQEELKAMMQFIQDFDYKVGELLKK